MIVGDTRLLTYANESNFALRTPARHGSRIDVEVFGHLCVAVQFREWCNVNQRLRPQPCIHSFLVPIRRENDFTLLRLVTDRLIDQPIQSLSDRQRAVFVLREGIRRRLVGHFARMKIYLGIDTSRLAHQFHATKRILNRVAGHDSKQ